jgi:hypothetical protein
MPEHDKIEVLVESINRYVKTNCELIKLEATERTSVIGSCLISNLLIGLVGILIIFFILMIGRRTLIERPLRDKIIRKIFSRN